MKGYALCAGSELNWSKCMCRSCWKNHIVSSKWNTIFACSVAYLARCSRWNQGSRIKQVSRMDKNFSDSSLFLLKEIQTKNSKEIQLEAVLNCKSLIFCWLDLTGWKRDLKSFFAFYSVSSLVFERIRLYSSLFIAVNEVFEKASCVFTNNCDQLRSHFKFQMFNHWRYCLHSQKP